MTAQEFSDRFVSGRQPLLTIHNHQGNTGFFERKGRLLTDFRQKLTVVIEHQSTGIDDLEFPVAPIAVLIRAITRHPGLIMNNGFAAATQPVHQGRLADIGASDDCHDRTRQESAQTNLSRYRDAIKSLKNRNSFRARQISLN